MTFEPLGIYRPIDGSVLNAHITATSNAHPSSAVSYDNSASGLAATNVKTAIDEVVDLVGQAPQGLTSVATDINDLDGNGTVASPLSIRNIGDGKTYGNKDGVWTEIVGGGEWTTIEIVTVTSATSSILFDGLTTGKDYRVRWKDVDITGDGFVRTTFRESGTARNMAQIRQPFYPTSLGASHTSGATFIDWNYDQYLVGATGEGFIILHNTNQTNAWCEGKGYQKHNNTGFGGHLLIATSPQIDGQKINELLFSSGGSTFAAGTFILEELNE